jgi:hypothetical protein
MGKPPRTLTLAKRTSFLERADAVRRLQQIGLHRQASLLRANIHNEIERLRGDLHVATPYMGHFIKKEIEALVKQLQSAPRHEYAGHWGSINR